MAAPWRVKVDEEVVDGAQRRLEVAVVQVYHLPVARELLARGGGGGKGGEQQQGEEEEKRTRRRSRRHRRACGRFDLPPRREQKGVVLEPTELTT